MKEQNVILLVEDNDDDAFFLDRAVSKAGMGMILRRVRNGQEAIDYLEGIEPFEDRAGFPLPNVIMLDLKMPVCDGFDFLAWKRKQAALVHVPTIVMTSSDLPRDVRRSYELGAHSFTTKLRCPATATKICHCASRSIIPSSGILIPVRRHCCRCVPVTCWRVRQEVSDEDRIEDRQ
jgi:CheY-like chemotaxis protein